MKGVLLQVCLLAAATAFALPSAADEGVRPYADMRGFDIQPPWASNGRDIWLNRFDANEYRRIVLLGKEAFPKMNTLRVWLSFDAWLDSPELATANMRRAGEIVKEAGLKMIPVYFNGWHSTPDFGGFSNEQLVQNRAAGFGLYRRYVAEVAPALEATGAVLMSDLSNEPLNNTLGNEEAVENVRAFILAMGEEIRKHSHRPVTVGSQGQLWKRPYCGVTSDFELFDKAVDVFSIHPYATSAPRDRATHLSYVRKLIAEADRLHKPIVITECCWDDDFGGDKERGAIVDFELSVYVEAGIGFVAHGLSPSPVADLHKKNPNECRTLDMYFMDLKGGIRPYHDVFNRY